MKERLEWAVHMAQLGHLASMREVLVEEWRNTPYDAFGPLLAGDPELEELPELAANVGWIYGLLELAGVLQHHRGRPRDGPATTRAGIALARARSPMMSRPRHLGGP